MEEEGEEDMSRMRNSYESELTPRMLREVRVAGRRSGEIGEEGRGRRLRAWGGEEVG